MFGADGVTVMVAFPFTVTQTTLEVTLPQLFVTTAWKQVFELTGPNTYEEVVAPTIFVHGPVLVGPDCH
jgi:hypothetical protein